jgi:CelD/BcsL family acetyltransferase involved in cellulose biosynthesis
MDDAKARFLSEPMREAFHAVAAAASAHGWLRLEILEIGGAPAAGYLCFEYGHRLWIYNSGLDPMFHGLSPGWALLGHLIRSAAESGLTAVDFMRGEEEYKIRLGGVVRHVERLTLTRPQRP